VRRRFRIVIDGEVYEVEATIEEGAEIGEILRSLSQGVVRTEASPEAAGGNFVVAPITGRVLEVRVSEGQEIRKGDVVMVMESMKTHLEVRCEKEGVVKRVLVRAGETVRQGQPVFELR